MKIAVDIRADRDAEPAETFSVQITSVSGATAADGVGLVTIRPTATGLSLGDVVVTEPDSGTARRSRVPATLGGPANKVVSFGWQLRSGSATVGSDAPAASGTGTIPKGAMGTLVRVAGLRRHRPGARRDAGADRHLGLEHVPRRRARGRDPAQHRRGPHADTDAHADPDPRRHRLRLRRPRPHRLRRRLPHRHRARRHSTGSPRPVPSRRPARSSTSRAAPATTSVRAAPTSTPRRMQGSARTRSRTPSTCTSPGTKTGDCSSRRPALAPAW